MQKTLFIYQRWFLRIFSSCMILPVVFLLQMLISKLMGIEKANFGYILICVITAFIGMAIYYKYTQHHKWFIRSGAYWVKDGVVYIEKENKTHALKNIKWLNGTTVSAYGMTKAGMLVIRYGKKKITLVSSFVSEESFLDSKLFPLFEVILANNPELKKDDTSDFWYECK